MNNTGIRKNYSGRMIFGDEKLTPLSLRATLRSRLRLGSFNSGIWGLGLGSNFPKFCSTSFRRTSHIPQTLSRDKE